MKQRSKPVVIFIGNMLYKDDKIALLIGEKIKQELEKQQIDVEIVERMGFALIDLIEGRDKVIIVDSIKTGRFKVGEVVIIEKINYNSYTPFSPHYVGIPETLKLLKELKLKHPEKVCIIGIEVKDPYTISEKMSEELERQFNNIVNNVRTIIKICLEGI